MESLAIKLFSNKINQNKNDTVLTFRETVSSKKNNNLFGTEKPSYLQDATATHVSNRVVMIFLKATKSKSQKEYL